MKIQSVAVIAAALLSAASIAQVPSPQPTPPPGITRPLSPTEVVSNARPDEWAAIPASDLLIMTLTPDAAGRERRAIIQLMPAPFSEGWVANIRTLARAHWWDGLAVVRVQDNYVTQWGDPDGEDAARARALPAGLRVMTEEDYLTPVFFNGINGETIPRLDSPLRDNAFGPARFSRGWPVGLMSGSTGEQSLFPLHCYGMVGVGRNLSPDTGTGAELYTVIGHAPRHLDANIALVGRVIEGMQHLSSLPRGTGPLGFYETPGERTTITSIRLASQLAAAEQPRFQYLSTDSTSFGRYADARANRRDPFFIRPAGGADVCNIPVPVRRVLA
jgi:cyclophilin family peptidyl-prolyl cis-trans isomerase